MRELLHQEYEMKMRSAFEELDEVRVTLEENAREKQAKNERTLERQLADKDSEIEEINALVAKLQQKVKEQRAQSGQADRDI